MAARFLARRSRRQLFWLVAGLALCQVVLAVAVDGYLPQVRDPEYTIKLTRLRVRRAEAPDRPLVLILGSSRTAFGLDARRLSASADGASALVFNFGQMGAGPLLNLTILRRLLDAGLRPDLLYVELVPNMLVVGDGRLMEERLLDGARLRADEVWRLAPHYRQPARLLGGWALGRGLPCYRHQAELRQLLALDTPSDTAPTGAHIDSHGWFPRHDLITHKDHNASSALVLAQNREQCGCSTLAPEPVGALEELLALCRRERIAVTLVRLPEGSTFRAMYTPAARAAFTGLLAQMRAKWGVPALDAPDWVADAGFWDTHHMLPDGARCFTERFAQEAVYPALAQLRSSAVAARP